MAEHQPEDVAEYKVLLCIQITVISAARIKNTKGRREKQLLVEAFLGGGSQVGAGDGDENCTVGD